MFLVFVSITQFSDFLVINYKNWKHILDIFKLSKLSFYGIFVIKHTLVWPIVREKSHQHNFWEPHQRLFPSHQNATHKNSPFPILSTPHTFEPSTQPRLPSPHLSQPAAAELIPAFLSLYTHFVSSPHTNLLSFPILSANSAEQKTGTHQIGKSRNQRGK